MDHTTAVRLTRLTKTYGAVRAVDSLDLDIPAGQVIALLGPNGAGKSTVVDLLLGLSRPDSGSAELFDMTPRDACAAGRVGVVLQSGGLPADTHVRELLTLLRGLYPKGMSPVEALATAGIEALADRPTDRLSGGEKQ